MTEEKVRTIRKGDMTFEITDPPKGHTADPVDIVINSGGIWIPRWLAVDQEHKHLRREFAQNTLLTSAIWSCQHTFEGYKKEMEDLHYICSDIDLAHEVYLNNGDLDTETARRLIDSFEKLFHVHLPEKKKARNQIGKSISSKDSLGRRNPGANAARLVSALFNIQMVRQVNMRVIAAQVYARMGALGMVMAENQAILKHIEGTTTSILANPGFTTSDFANSLTYNRNIAKLKKLAIDAERLWGAPYDAFGIFIADNLDSAWANLEDKHHLLAKKHLRMIRDGFTEIRKTSWSIETKVKAFQISDWRKNPKNALLALDKIRQYLWEHSPSHLEK